MCKVELVQKLCWKARKRQIKREKVQAEQQSGIIEMAHQVSDTVAYAVMYYATDVAAIMYNNNAQANNFVLWDKGQTQELSIVSDYGKEVIV